MQFHYNILSTGKEGPHRVMVMITVLGANLYIAGVLECSAVQWLLNFELGHAPSVQLWVGIYLNNDPQRISVA